VELPDRVTDATWSRIASGQGPIFGLVAEDQTGNLAGFCNYVCHPNTWSDQTVCYLEDLFVSETARRTGLGTRFIGFLTELGRREGWYRLYWITNEDNEPARKAYDRVAKRTNHLRYEITF
jgi:GNAT superfamily N-acetyltransferase